MLKNTFLGSLFLLFSLTMFSQEYILAVQKPYVVFLDAETGDVANAQGIDMSALNVATPKAVKYVGNEIWVTDQLDDVIYKFDSDGNHVGTITGSMDNIKGFDIINDSEIWVTNAGSQNGAPGDAVVRLDMDGNYLGSYDTPDKSSFDVLDNGTNVLVSFIHQGSPIEVWDYDGNYINNFVDPGTLNFPQQINFTQDGHLLVANFSAPSGIYLFDGETGVNHEFWPTSGPRGVVETDNGSILWSNNNGIHRLNPSTGVSTLILSGNTQYFGKRTSISGCITPSLSVANPDPVCEGNTATITATSNGQDVFWYNSATSTSPIGSGLSFTTPELSETTSFWVQAFNYGAGGEPVVITGGARTAPTSSSSSSVNPGTAPWGLSFDADENFTINSVDVYLAGSAGSLTVQLLDENWSMIEEITLSTPAGNSANPVQHEIELNFEVQAGNTYRLVASSSPEMIREFTSEHPGYPYDIGDVGTVTGGTLNNSNSNNTVYYFFYNWTVSTFEGEVCESDREEVIATVNPTPETPGGEADQQFNQGETLADLTVEATGDLIWYEDAQATTVLPETTPLVDGTTYYVSQTIDDCESNLFAITVHLRLGTGSFENFALFVFPNPVIDMLNIKSEKPVDSVEVFDITGRKLIEKSDIRNSQFDMSSYSAGTYLVRIKAGKEVQMIKVLKN